MKGLCCMLHDLMLNKLHQLKFFFYENIVMHTLSHYRLTHTTQKPNTNTMSSFDTPLR